MRKLKQTLGNETEETPLSMERGNGGNSFSSKEEDDRKRTEPGKTSRNFFPQEMYKLVLHGGGKPVNPQSRRIDGRVKSFTLWYGES